MYYNERVDTYIHKQCIKYNTVVEWVDNLVDCVSVILFYNNKKIILINRGITGKQICLSILHELSHIDLGFIGEAFEKKGKNNIKEKIVNINMIIKNRAIIKGWILPYIVLALISEKKLFKMMEFKEDTNV